MKLKLLQTNALNKLIQNTINVWNVFNCMVGLKLWQCKGVSLQRGAFCNRVELAGGVYVTHKATLFNKLVKFLPLQIYKTSHI